MANKTPLTGLIMGIVGTTYLSPFILNLASATSFLTEHSNYVKKEINHVGAMCFLLFFLFGVYIYIFLCVFAFVFHQPPQQTMKKQKNKRKNTAGFKGRRDTHP